MQEVKAPEGRPATAFSCSEGHPTIWYECWACPVCYPDGRVDGRSLAEIAEELVGKVEELSADVTGLASEVEELHRRLGGG